LNKVILVTRKCFALLVRLEWTMILKLVYKCVCYITRNIVVNQIPVSGQISGLRYSAFGYAGYQAGRISGINHPYFQLLPTSGKRRILRKSLIRKMP
jgi:hypothetical protein